MAQRDTMLPLAAYHPTNSTHAHTRTYIAGVGLGLTAHEIGHNRQPQAKGGEGDRC